MNKFYRNTIGILFVMLIFVMLTHQFNYNLSSSYIFLIAAGGYGIYLNLRAHSKAVNTPRDD